MVLIVSYHDEDHSLEVIKYLTKWGREYALVDLSDFPSICQLTLNWQMESPYNSFIVETGFSEIDLGRINVTWWRRIRPFTIDKKVQSPSAQLFAQSETSQAVNGMFNSLECKWVNDRAADEAAHHKPYQWSVAQRLGLKLPRTLVTNSPSKALNFIREIGINKVVFKAFLASLEAWRETRLVLEEDLDQLESVRYAPVIFQEYIKGVDLRITIVGDSIFAAEIDAQQTSYPIDMRMVLGEAEVKSCTLPDEIHSLLLKLLRNLGLVYGAVDMRRTSEGEYYFLEVNPAGQWLFVEQRTNQPISMTLAQLLVNNDL